MNDLDIGSMAQHTERVLDLVSTLQRKVLAMHQLARKHDRLLEMRADIKIAKVGFHKYKTESIPRIALELSEDELSEVIDFTLNLLAKKIRRLNEEIETTAKEIS